MTKKFLKKYAAKNCEKEYFIFSVCGMEYHLNYDEIKYNTQIRKYTFRDFGKSKFKYGYSVNKHNFGVGQIIASWDFKNPYVEELITGIKIPIFLRKVDRFNIYIDNCEYPETPIYIPIHAMYEAMELIKYKLPYSKLSLKKATTTDIDKYIKTKDKIKFEESLTAMFNYYENAYYYLLKEFNDTILEKQKEKLKIKKLVCDYKVSIKK